MEKSTEILLVMASERNLDLSKNSQPFEIVVSSNRYPYEVHRGSKSCRKINYFLLSKTKPAYFVWRLGSHPQNLKYILKIDSEQVPWGKGERELSRVKSLKFNV